MNKSVVRQKIWSDKRYYQRIAQSENFSHPGFRLAQKFCDQAKNILDVGCGDGSKLAKLGGPSAKRVGCEVSPEAMEIGRKKFPQIEFSLQEGEYLPFKSDTFDKVTSFFVLEHSGNPEKLIKEMLRVCKHDGLIILLAPNFGAPNRASPNFVGNRWIKLLKGIRGDFLTSDSSLSWQKVDPTIDSMVEFRPDLDTTIEPYLLSLIKFLKARKSDIIEAKSFWEMEVSPIKAWQRMFHVLSEMGIYPFKYWGPHLFVVTKKVAA